jgi:hypothetical protein
MKKFSDRKNRFERGVKSHRSNEESMKIINGVIAKSQELPASTKNRSKSKELIINTTSEEEFEEVKVADESALMNRSANKLLQIIKTPTRE